MVFPLVSSALEAEARAVTDGIVKPLGGRDIYPMSPSLKANYLMKQNVSAILRAKHKTQKDLAMYCHRKESWISKILTVDVREFPMKYYDRIADFLGVPVYQLFIPGVANSTERRSGLDRRKSPERRLTDQQRIMSQYAVDIDLARPRRQPTENNAPLPASRVTAESARDLEALRQHVKREYQRILGSLGPTRKTPRHRRKVPTAS